MVTMGMQMGLEGTGQYCKRQNRWVFTVPEVIGDLGGGSGGLNCLPPEKSARPNISFKETSVQHISEEVFYPVKPDWKPITITAFDLKKSKHPVWNWLKYLYDVSNDAKFYPPNNTPQGFIKKCSLVLVDGCGIEVEKWTYEDCWPQSVNFQTLDMTQFGVVMCEVTLRYARAYINE